jgi:poly(3-hydroxyoctanoate) depolymerase
MIGDQVCHEVCLSFRSRLRKEWRSRESSMSKPKAPSRLLFLPGALGNRNFWKPLALQLFNRAESVFMSYPGFGGAPTEPSISCLEDLVNDIVSRIDRPTALIAQSMGGVIAVKAALLKQGFITHLVLAATSGGIDTAKLAR